MLAIIRRRKQDILFSSLLFKNLKIKIYRTINLPIVLYGCANWSLKLGEGRRLRVLENRVVGEYLGLRGKRKQGNGENYIVRSLMICTHQPILCG